MVLSSNQNKSQNFLLSVFSKRNVKRNILYGDCGVGIVQVEENTIQGTLKCGVEVISLTSHRPETKHALVFLPLTLIGVMDYTTLLTICRNKQP